jgi:hypothetical protein
VGHERFTQAQAPMSVRRKASGPSTALVFRQHGVNKLSRPLHPRRSSLHTRSGQPEGVRPTSGPVKRTMQLPLRFAQDDQTLAGQSPREALLVIVDMLVELRVPGDNQRQTPGSPSLQDGRRPTMTNDDLAVGEKPLHVTVVEKGGTLRPPGGG